MTVTELVDLIRGFTGEGVDDQLVVQLDDGSSIRVELVLTDSLAYLWFTP